MSDSKAALSNRIKAIGRAAEILLAYLAKQDDKLKTDPSHVRQETIGKKLGAIEYFEALNGVDVAEACKQLKKLKVNVGKGRLVYTGTKVYQESGGKNIQQIKGKSDIIQWWDEPVVSIKTDLKHRNVKITNALIDQLKEGQQTHFEGCPAREGLPVCTCCIR